jgi:hypothetical protein
MTLLLGRRPSHSCHQYTPLPPSQENISIRLLTLLPGARGTQIQCTLEDAPGIFDSSSPASIAFTALSYVWGDPTITVPILINGYLLFITSNLCAFLHRLRSQDTAQIFWADAICINQASLSERSSQVKLMDRIYASASQVLIWLGEENESTALAFRAAKKIAVGAAVKNAEMLAEMVEADEDFSKPDVIASLEFGYEDLKIEEVAGMEEVFFERSWWNRLWIVQEAVLARDATIMCGSFNIPWGTIAAVLTASDPAKDLPPEEFEIAERGMAALRPWTRLHVIRTGELFERQGIHRVLNWTSGNYRPRGCHDPRDIVYGLLGLVNFAGKSIEIVPDYTKPITAVYTELARAVIEDRRNLSTICVPTIDISHISSFSEGRTPFSWLPPEEKIPSWVPDYYCCRYSQIVKDPDSRYRVPEVFSADKGAVLDVETALSGSDEMLKLQRIAWDTVIVCSHTPRVEGVSNVDSRAAMAQTWKSILRGKEYPTGEDMAAVFYRTLRRDIEVGLQGKDQRLSLATVEKHKKGFEAWLDCTEDSLENYRILMKRDPETGKNYRIYSLDASADAEYGFMQSLITLLIDRDKTFFLTEKGYFGIADGRAEVGDEICIVFGACVPLVLRGVGKRDRGWNEGGGTVELELVGTAYVCGIMDGEVVEAVGFDVAESFFLV